MRAKRAGWSVALLLQRNRGRRGLRKTRRLRSPPALQEREPLKAMRGSELQGHDSSGSVQSLEPQEQANGPDAVPQALPVESAQAPALMQEPLIYRESEAETTRPADHKAPAQATGETTHPNQTTHARSSAQAEKQHKSPDLDKLRTPFRTSGDRYRATRAGTPQSYAWFRAARAGPPQSYAGF